MKYRNEYIDNEKKKEKLWKKEQNTGGFKCSHCKQWVVINNYMGTMNRNHCNICLWSKHVDKNKGDRKMKCHGGMEPIGLTFKHEGAGRQGEIMLVHECAQCNTISINRIAGDDDNEKILTVFEGSTFDHNLSNTLRKKGITMLVAEDRAEINIQLFGRIGDMR